MSGIRNVLIVLGLAAIGAAPALGAEGRQLTTFEGITAYLSDDFVCGERAQISLTATDPGAFSDEPLMGRLVGGLRAALGFECPEIKDILLLGVDDGETVYRAVTSAATGWSVMTLTLAAAPEVADLPEAERETTEGRGQERETAEAEPPAMIPSLPTPEEVTVLPQGFVPPPSESVTAPETRSGSQPQAVHDPFDDMEKQVRSAQRQPFNHNLFLNPTIMYGLYHGDFSKLGALEYETFLYIHAFNEYFAQPYNLHDPTCVLLYDPAIKAQLSHRMMYGERALFGGGSMEQQGMQVLGQMARLLMEAQRGGGQAIVGQAMQLDVIKAQAPKDAARLVIAYQDDGGCQSEVVQQIYYNLGAYAGNRRPIYSPQYAREREEQEAREAEERERLEREQREQEAREAEERKQEAFRTGALTSCQNSYGESPFCNCALEQLEGAALTDNEWQEVGENFRATVSLSRSRPELRQELRACLG